MKIVARILVLLLTSTCIYSQKNINNLTLFSESDQQTHVASVDTAWVRYYDSGYDQRYDEASDMTVDAAGNIYVTGYSYGQGGNYDYLTVMYDPSGGARWAVQYDGSGARNDAAHAIALDGAGNIYVTGSSEGPAFYTDFVTIKYNGSGEEQWVARYDGPESGLDKADVLVVDGSGHVYVAGYSLSSNGQIDYTTIKYDANGEMLWVARYGGPLVTAEHAIDLKIDLEGNVYLMGQMYAVDTYDDFFILKYSPSGQELWTAHYNGSVGGYDRPAAMALDDKGNVYVTGSCAGLNENREYVTIKYDEQGCEKWVAGFGGPRFSLYYATDLALDDEGNVYVTGYCGKGYQFDNVTIKYDASGVEQWTARNGSETWSRYPVSLALDEVGNVYVTGANYASGSDEFTTIKTDASGEEQWTLSFDGPENSMGRPSALAVDEAGNIYVAGVYSGNGWSYCTTIKYRQEDSTVPAVDPSIPADFVLEPNHPNPFNSGTLIPYQTMKPSNVDIGIYNLQGQKIATLFQGFRNAGRYDVSWDGMTSLGSVAASGVYLCRLKACGYVKTIRIVMQK